MKIDLFSVGLLKEKTNQCKMSVIAIFHNPSNWDEREFIDDPILDDVVDITDYDLFLFGSGMTIKELIADLLDYTTNDECKKSDVELIVKLVETLKIVTIMGWAVQEDWIVEFDYKSV